MADELSRRERIMREVCRRLSEIQEGQPTDDPFRVTFGVVTRGSSLEGIHKTEKYACSVLDTEETKIPKINQMDVLLRVVVEFSAWVDDGVQPSQVGNLVLLDLQRKMREDLKLTEPDDGRPRVERELSNNVVETGNQLFIEGFADRRITGALFLNVSYKHGIQDPRELVSSLA